MHVLTETNVTAVCKKTRKPWAS